MGFFQTVKQIGIFMICAQAILHFKPSAKYEKYIKLLISVMVLVQLLVPAIDFLAGNNSEFFFERMEEIQGDIEREMEQLQIENAINEKNILNETKKEIQSRLDALWENQGLKVAYIQFNEKETESRLIVYVQKEEASEISIPQIEIDSIEWANMQGVVESSGQITEQDDTELHMLRKQISVELGIKEEEIEVFFHE
jgi:hypothetical protein